MCYLLFLVVLKNIQPGLKFILPNTPFPPTFSTMKQQTLTIQTTKLFDVKDLTDQVPEFLENISAKSGIVNIFTQHTTTAIKINEFEDGFFADMKEVLFKDIAPIDRAWKHNNEEERDPNTMCDTDGCLNGHSHIAQMLVGSTSESIPVINGKMQLGRWQRILFFEMDRPRERKVILSFMSSPL